MLLNKNILISILLIGFLALSGESYAGVTKFERSVETEEICKVETEEQKIAFVKVRKQSIKIFTKHFQLKQKSKTFNIGFKANFLDNFCSNKQNHYLQFRRLLI
jgi:hypothetical protein